MARISTYPIISTPTLNDLLIGTDVDDLNITKNFLLGDVATIISNDFVPYVGATGNVNLGVFSIEAASFIVEGGLASEFVKADGSLDSTIYTPQSRTLTINSVTFDLSANRSWDLNTIDTLTTTGTSGPATYIGKTLNIPQYQAQGNYITQLSGEATAMGPGNATVTLSNLAVINKVLTGLNITGGTVVDTDSILTAFGKVQNQINGLAGGVTYEGTWNATTNVPFLQSSVGVQGHYYVVSVAGNTNLNGITDWQLGDWAIFNGSVWEKVDNTDAVVSVNGYTGAVVLTFSDVGAPPATRNLTINGVQFDLTADRTWTVGDVRTDQTYANPTWITSLAWTKITGTPTTLAGYGITDGVSSSRTITINGVTFDLTANRTWNVGTVTSVGTSGPLTGGTITTSGTIGITQSGASSDGYLSSIDWNTFNNKQNALTNPVTGTGTIYTLPMWSGATSLVDSPLSYGPDAFNFQYNSATGGTVNFTNIGLTSYTYSIQMNNFGSPRSTVHSYTDGVVIQSIAGTQVSRMFANGNFILGDGAADNGYKLAVEGNLYIETIVNATTDTDRFIVSDGGVIKYRTGAQLLSDIGAQGSLTLTTTGTSGAATLIGNVLNIPQYTDQFIGTVTSVAALTLGTSGTDLSSTVANSTTTPVITLNVPTASAVNRGALSAADWTTFNNKQPAGNYITSLIGEATATGPGAASVTLDNTAVIGKVLTGLNVTGGTIISTDNILSAFGKVQNQINGLIGGSTFQGTWNASTNTPTLTSGVGTNGHYYIVSVDGSTNLDGITDWKVGDWAIFAGTTWEKVDNTDAVNSVNGYTGIVSLVTGDVLEGAGTLPGRPSQLYFTDARSRAAISLTTTGTSGPATYSNVTGILNIPNYTTDLTGYVPYTGANQTVNLNTQQLQAGHATFTTNGTTDTLTVNHTSGSGYGIIVTKSGNNEALYVSKTSGSGNAMTVVGGRTSLVDLALSSVTNTVGDFLTISGGVVHKRTAAEVRTDIGAQGTITLTTTGTSGVSTLIGSTLNIPNYTTDLSGYVTIATDQTITGLKTIVRVGASVDVLDFKIGTDTIYGLKVAYNQNELAPSGEATWSFVNTFNRDGSGFSVTPISFFRGVLVTGERLLSSSINSNLLSYYASNPTGRYPIYAYNTGVQQFASSIIVGETAGVVNPSTGAIADLPAGVVANFKGRVIGSNAVNSNEFVTLSQIGGLGTGTVTSVAALTLGTTGTDLSSTVANSTTTPVITLNVPTASATNRGALSAADWTTFNNKQNALTNPVTGTGSAGQVAYWSSSSAITGESNLFWDATNDRLGITTNTPTSKLAFGIIDIIGEIGRIGFDVAGNQRAYIAANRHTATGQLSDLSFGVMGNEAMRIFSGQNVNIGTTPALDYGAKLQVSGSDNTNIFMLLSGANSRLHVGTVTSPTNDVYIRSQNNYNLNLGVNTTDYLSISNTGNSTFVGNIILTTGANRYVRIGSSTAYYYDLQTTGDDFQIIETGTTPRLTIKYPNGNVGINTTTPATTLEVNGVGLFTGTSLVGNTKNGIYIYDQAILSLAGTGPRPLQIQGQTLSIYTGTTYSEKLKVFENGNVVISTSPSDAGFKLDVNGTVRFSGTLTATSANFSSTTSHTGTASFGAGGPTAIDGSDGKLIIPKIRVYNSAPATQYHDITSAALSNRFIIIPDASGTMALTSDLSGYLPLTGGTLTGALGGTTANFSGNVTMGGNDGFSTRLYVRTENTANTPSLTLFKNVSSGSTEDIFRVQSFSGGFITTASIKANGSANFAGDVLVGNATASGSGLLSIAVGNSVGGAVKVHDTDGGGTIEMQASGGLTYLYTTTNHALSIGTNNTERLNISNTGAATFSSSVTANGLNALGSTLNNGNVIRFYRAGLVEMAYIGWSNENANNSTWLFKSINGNPIAFSADGTNQQLIVNTNGNVLIGTPTDTGYKLYVNGIAGFSSSVTANNYISNQEGINVSNYGFLSQTLSGQMTIIGHNLRASTSVNNQVDVVNGGWFSSMIRMYYSDGITFHTSNNIYAAGAVYPMAALEVMRIAINGNVGIGTNNPTSKFQVSGTNVPAAIYSDNNSLCLGLGYQGVLSGYVGGISSALYAYSTNGGYVLLNSSSVWVAASDVKRKRNFEPYTKGLSAILGLQPKLYNMDFQEDGDEKQVGLVAQEVREFIPLAYEDNAGFIGLNYNAIIVTMVKAIQEQQQQIQELKNKLS